MDRQTIGGATMKAWRVARTPTGRVQVRRTKTGGHVWVTGGSLICSVHFEGEPGGPAERSAIADAELVESAHELRSLCRRLVSKADTSQDFKDLLDRIRGIVGSVAHD